MVPESADRSLVLVIDPDNGGRHTIRKVLGNLNFDVVRAANGLAGLELIQRLPHSFRLVLTDLDLPGVPGLVIIDTLRLFRPDLPVLCMVNRATAAVIAAPAHCLDKPLQPDELRLQVEAALAGTVASWEPISGSLTDHAVQQARARYEQGKSLVDAAMELARGYREE